MALQIGCVHGVEPICNVLLIDPLTYRKHFAQRRDSSCLTLRANRDLAFKPEFATVFTENFAANRVRKVWRQMTQEGFRIATCTSQRLVGDIGLAGVIRSKPVRTTISAKAARSPLDRFNRQFHT